MPRPTHARCTTRRATARFGIALSTSALAALFLLPSSNAAAQGKNDANRPTFQDERRWTPKTEPAHAQPAPGAAISTPSTAAMPTAADPTVKNSGPASCGTPAAKATALEAGRMRIAVTSQCRATQAFVWTYGGAEFAAVLDKTGRHEILLDAFAGTSTPVEIKFADETVLALPVEALDLDKVSKVALLWSGPADLDLHAFEYAALPGNAGHVTPAAPSSLAAVREWVEKSGRGHGYLSTNRRDATSAQPGRERLQVYTFLHKDGQLFGLVSTAVDFATRGERAAPPYCGKDAQAEVPFRVVSWSRSGQAGQETGVIASAECGQALAQSSRLNPGAMPVIRIRN